MGHFALHAEFHKLKFFDQRRVRRQRAEHFRRAHIHSPSPARFSVRLHRFGPRFPATPPLLLGDSKGLLLLRWHDAGSLHPHTRALRQHVAVAAFQPKSHKARVEQETHFCFSRLFAGVLLPSLEIPLPANREANLQHTISSTSLDYLATRRHAGHVCLRTIRHGPVAQLQPVRSYRSRDAATRPATAKSWRSPTSAIVAVNRRNPVLVF